MKLYAKIPHLPGSRAGADRSVPPNIAQRMTQQALAGDTVVVQEKLDGTCVVLWRKGDALEAYGREGRLCALSRNHNRRAFADWLAKNEQRFGWLREGERLVCEWLPVAHGTRYALPHEPLVVLDLFEADGTRVGLAHLNARLANTDLPQPMLLHSGRAMSLEEALRRLGEFGFHGALEPAEGLVYRLERDGQVIQTTKYVRPNKIDGLYLEDHSGLPIVYNTWVEPRAVPNADMTLLEGWLRRAIKHPLSSRLILRGSLLLTQWCAKARVPVDVDYLVLGEFDAQAMVRLAGEVGATLDGSTTLRLERTEIIWANTAFPGVRAHLTGSVEGSETQAFQVDFAFGDPLPHEPQSVYISNVGKLQACTPETLFGWKLHGLAEFGLGRWRAKDLYDLYLMAGQLELDPKKLLEAIPLAFSSRGDSLELLTDFRTREGWGLSFSSQRTWRTFLKKNQLEQDFLLVRETVRRKLEEIGL